MGQWKSDFIHLFTIPIDRILVIKINLLYIFSKHFKTNRHARGHDKQFFFEVYLSIFFIPLSNTYNIVELETV